MPVLRTAQVAVLFGVCRRTVWLWKQRGLLTPVYPMSVWDSFDVDEVEELRRRWRGKHFGFEDAPFTVTRGVRS